MTIREAYDLLVETLKPLYGEPEATAIARIAMEDGLHIIDRSSPALLHPDQIDLLDSIRKRLLQQEPIQYITGKTKFAGLWLKTDPRALIPRQETEEMVALLLEENKNRKTLPLKVLDIGTGTGCIPIALKKKCPAWQVFAIDNSANALHLAQENAALNQTQITFLELDILHTVQWDLLPDFDIIASNPPYIPHREKALMPAQVLEYEPHEALFVTDEEPLLFYKAIHDFCKKKLNPGGAVYLECNEFNAKEGLTIFQTIFSKVHVEQDIMGKNRFIVGKR